MTRTASQRRRPLGLSEQLAWFRQTWSAEDWRVERQGKSLVAVGRVKPTPLSQTYKIRVTYSNFIPAVSVISPVLRHRDGVERIPHTFTDGSLCLYYPSYKEWTREMPLATTVITWISEWLCFYEIWRVTGAWEGGGIHPGNN